MERQRKRRTHGGTFLWIKAHHVQPDLTTYKTEEYKTITERGTTTEKAYPWWYIALDHVQPDLTTGRA